VSFDSQLRYKPWWIAQHLTAPASYSKSSTSHGLDNYFVDHAMKFGKQIGGLESVNEHVAVMGGLSDRDGEFMLQDALTQPDNGDKESGRMYKAWRKGDINGLWAGDASLRSKAPRIAARFVDDRNVKWIPRIEAELKTGKPTAVVAGALHFSGPRSVITLLAKARVRDRAVVTSLGCTHSVGITPLSRDGRFNGSACGRSNPHQQIGTAHLILFLKS
jgi:Uncharacterized protein conserved in bacteria